MPQSALRFRLTQIRYTGDNVGREFSLSLHLGPEFGTWQRSFSLAHNKSLTPRRWPDVLALPGLAPEGRVVDLHAELREKDKIADFGEGRLTLTLRPGEEQRVELPISVVAQGGDAGLTAVVVLVFGVVSVALSDAPSPELEPAGSALDVPPDPPWVTPPAAAEPAQAAPEPTPKVEEPAQTAPEPAPIAEEPGQTPPAPAPQPPPAGASSPRSRVFRAFKYRLTREGGRAHRLGLTPRR